MQKRKWFQCVPSAFSSVEERNKDALEENKYLSHAPCESLLKKDYGNILGGKKTFQNYHCDLRGVPNLLLKTQAVQVVVEHTHSAPLRWAAGACAQAPLVQAVAKFSSLVQRELCVRTPATHRAIPFPIPQQAGKIEDHWLKTFPAILGIKVKNSNSQNQIFKKVVSAFVCKSAYVLSTVESGFSHGTFLLIQKIPWEGS